MPDTVEIRYDRIQPEDILTSKEAEVLQLGDRGYLSCPQCGQRLYGDKFVEEGIYTGIVLLCSDGCGFREY